MKVKFIAEVSYNATIKRGAFKITQVALKKNCFGSTAISKNA